MTSFGVFSYVHVRSYKQFDTFVDSVHYRYMVQLNLSLTVHVCHYYTLYTTRYVFNISCLHTWHVYTKDGLCFTLGIARVYALDVPCALWFA